MFDWIGKSVMEMTRSDEIAKSICIITVLAAIGLIGWAVDKLENRRENMNRSKNIKIDFRINGKHDHFIEKKPGKSIPKVRATKPKRRAK